MAGCGDEREGLPDGLEIEEVVASTSTGFFREGCESRIYRLSQASSDAIVEQGAASFADAVWSQTPLTESDAGRAIAGFASCPAKTPRYGLHDFETDLSRPGSYYHFNSNREGFTLVVPRRRVAVFNYVG
jgi:hypothetical protein